jgi:hypothetical protein
MIPPIKFIQEHTKTRETWREKQNITAMRKRNRSIQCRGKIVKDSSHWIAHPKPKRLLS